MTSSSVRCSGSRSPGSGGRRRRVRPEDFGNAVVDQGLSTNCLARCSVGAVNNAVPYTPPPNPPIPSYISAQGDLFSDWRRRAFLDGVNAATGGLRDFDVVRPAQGNRYSKDCLIELALHSGHRGGRATWRTQIAVERHILLEVLDTDLRRTRERLRHWANAP